MSLNCDRDLDHCGGEIDRVLKRHRVPVHEVLETVEGLADFLTAFVEEWL
jgi:hypothetical protein